MLLMTAHLLILMAAEQIPAQDRASTSVRFPYRTPGCAFHTAFLNEDRVSGILDIRNGERRLPIDANESTKDD